MPADAALADRLVEVQPDGARWLVLRYLVPGLGGAGRGFEDMVPLMLALCEADRRGVDAAAEPDEPVEQIVVVLMDRVIPRGTPDPEATQFIGAYLPTEEGCEWE